MPKYQFRVYVFESGQNIGLAIPRALLQKATLIYWNTKTIISYFQSKTQDKKKRRLVFKLWSQNVTSFKGDVAEKASLSICGVYVKRLQRLQP